MKQQLGSFESASSLDSDSEIEGSGGSSLGRKNLDADPSGRPPDPITSPQHHEESFYLIPPLSTDRHSNPTNPDPDLPGNSGIKSSSPSIRVVG